MNILHFQEVVSIGFPDSSVNSILAMVGNREPVRSDGCIVIGSYSLESNRFSSWKSNVELTVTSRQSSNASYNRSESVSTTAATDSSPSISSRPNVG